MKRFQKQMRAAACICALALGMTLPCAIAQEVPELLEPAGVMIDTATAYIGDISTIQVYDGSVVPYVEGLYFPVEGIVEEVGVVIGQEVRKGDVLVTLDQEAQQKQIARLQSQIDEMQINADYENALADIDRDILKVQLQALMNEKSRNEDAIALKKLEMEQYELDYGLNVDLRELEIERLREELALLEEQVGEKVLTAPFDGRIVFMQRLEKASYLSAYTPVMYIADDTRLTVDTPIISQNIINEAHDLYALIGGGRYDVTHVKMDEQDYMSHILSGEEIRMTFTVDEMDEAVKAGMYAAVCIESDYAGDVLLVPRNSVYIEASASYVYVIKDGVRERREVEVGIKNDWLAQIKSGISEGDVVYVKE